MSESTNPYEPPSPPPASPPDATGDGSIRPALMMLLLFAVGAVLGEHWRSKKPGRCELSGFRMLCYTSRGAY
ncbi:MAG TPA: hypothetical protein PLY87_26275 [Planctomycetaceae bacterium]|nr:hypothetical protein [Planctomycetaceae bacterium]